MAKSEGKARPRVTPKGKPIDLGRYLNWPERVPKDEFWQGLAKKARGYPEGVQSCWGLPFRLSSGRGRRAIIVAKGRPDVTIALKGTARYVCLVHGWEQIPATIRREDPCEGTVAGEYVLTYKDGSVHVQPVRGRFEVQQAESPGMPWLAMPFRMYEPIDPAKPHGDLAWGLAQYGYHLGHLHPWGPLWIYAMENPRPAKELAALTVRGLQESPLIMAGVTLYGGRSHPLRHLPRRTYRVSKQGKPVQVGKTEVDLGIITRIEKTSGPRGADWLGYPLAGSIAKEPEGDDRSRGDRSRGHKSRGAESLVEMAAAEDATLSVRLEGSRKAVELPVGEAFRSGASKAGGLRLEVLGKQRQWLTVRVIDASTGKPTPVRLHFSGAHGEYLAPYGHHQQINANWFEDYSADVIAGGMSNAYVPGEFATDLPVGDVFVQLYKGFEYEPLRTKVTIAPGQKLLELKISRWKDLRREGWVTADTHVHFISPQTAWLEAQAEGVNVVNLLASQWGRLFTNVGDYTGRVGVAEDDTIVYVGTENRNHMLGHMSMLGTKGLPVFPMCCGGVSESWIGDPDYLTLTEWAEENKRRGGVVIRPHFPWCGYTEDPAPIIKGTVDAVEIGGPRGQDFSTQEWYRYLNCGYRVAVVGGTDKMSAYCPLGWLRTYTKIDAAEPFTYDNWAQAVRAGRTISTNGPLLDLVVEGKAIGETIHLPSGAQARLNVQSTAESIWPINMIEIVCNGNVVARAESVGGVRSLSINETIAVSGSGWIAARCAAAEAGPQGYIAAAHTSPVYVKCGDSSAFNGPAAQHMLKLIEGGIEYLSVIATHADAASRERMIRVYREAEAELQRRLRCERG